MKKHVLFIVENNAVPNDVRVWPEAQAVKRFGYDVSVISPVNNKKSPKYEKINNIPIYRHSRPDDRDGKFSFLLEYSNALFWEFLLSFRIFLRKPFHYIHAANPPDHIFLIASIFKIFGTKFIFDHHDICPENYVAKFKKKDFFYRLLLLMEKLTFKTANMIISTNESYKKIAIQRGNKTNNSVFVVRNGPDLSKIPITKPNKKLKDGFDFLIGYVGVIGNQEGVDNLLKAVEYIVYNRKYENIKFIIVGRGPHRQSMIELSKRLKIEKYVTFTGYIPYKDLYEILATADVCVNPEYKNEFTDKSTMIKIMYYMVFGKPIVQFDTWEGRVTAGEASVYIKNNDEAEFADGIIHLLNDPIKRRTMGEIGRQRMEEQLHWGIQKKKLAKVYEHLENSSKN